MAVKFQDYYEILGVSRTATQDEIKKAFRRLARKHHPDVNPGDKTAEETFKKINEANEVLSDPEKRKKYDQFGENWKNGQEFSPPPSWGGGGGQQRGGYSFTPNEDGDFSEFFQQFFGAPGFGSRTRPRSPGFNPRGNDVEVELPVSISEVIDGATKEFSIRRGDGSTKTYRVKIPAKSWAGKQIKLAGQGDAGPSMPGDLILTLAYHNDPIFDVDGADLYCELAVAPWEAVLGAKVPLTTPDGALRVTIAPGTQNGLRLRLGGRGVYRPDGTRGDLYAIVGIELPEQLSAPEREAWEKLQEVSQEFDPRR